VHSRKQSGAAVLAGEQSGVAVLAGKQWGAAALVVVVSRETPVIFFLFQLFY
jgi:hypothetical protein